MLRLAELERRLAEVHAEVQPVDLKSPFSPLINQEKADPRMKLPKLESYDGTGDPYDHTSAYEIVMGYYNHSDAGMCKIFITTLTKAAKQWIVSLPSGSINSWKELTDKFHERFGSNKRRGKLTASLMQIKQKGNESLGQYVQRFRDAVGNIAELNMTQALGFFTTGLDFGRAKKLMKDIMFSPPKDLADAYERAEKFVMIEEAMSSLNPVQRVTDKPKGEGTKSGVWDRIGSKANATQSDRPFRPRQEEKVYTPLNTDRVNILNELRGKPQYEPPPPLRSKGDRRFFCEYHQAKGHKTGRCTALKELIEKNVQNGELVQYVAARQAPMQPQTEHNHEGGPRRVVDVITGGTLKKQTGKRHRATSDTVMSLEAVTRSANPFPGTVISFSDTDYPPDTVEPHEGALVITAQVGPVDMKRMMIDNGSSVDVLYSHAYQRMNLEGVMMQVGLEAP